MNLYVGTSGYGYKPWKGKFYPKDLPDNKMLSYYAENFPAVEVNNTFYSMPKVDVLKSWLKEVPNSFGFIIKAPSKITHTKRLKECEEEMEYFLRTCSSLNDNLRGYLFQLPPNAKKNIERLSDFIKLIPENSKAAFEFRHESWFDKETYEVLSSRNLALCIADTDEQPADEIISTASWGYLRLRKADYDKAALKRWYKKITAQNWEEAYIFIKHEEEANGPRFAKQFMENISQKT